MNLTRIEKIKAIELKIIEKIDEALDEKFLDAQQLPLLLITLDSLYKTYSNWDELANPTLPNHNQIKKLIKKIEVKTLDKFNKELDEGHIDGQQITLLGMVLKALNETYVLEATIDGA